MLIVPISLLLLSGPGLTAPLTLTNATDTTKYFVTTVDTSGTLHLAPGGNDWATLSSGGGLGLNGTLLAYGTNANPVLVQGGANNGNVLIGVNPGSTGPNVGAVIGNIIGTGALMAQVPTSTTTGGNARGANAVDLQTTRGAASNVASATGSAVLGGFSNSATAQYATAAGLNCLASGNQSFAIGNSTVADSPNTVATGSNSNAHGLYGANVHASGTIAASGDAQSGTYVLRGRSTGGAAVRLTADGAAAGSANVCNLPNNTAWFGTLYVVARDTAAGSVNVGMWRYMDAAPIRGANAASTVVVVGAAAFTSNGAGPPVSGNLAISADTTNGGINLTFTPPNSNTWDVVAVFRTSEVQ
ncbi:hypothetical protein UFOVP78_13 [uncultured Caudovirales phage]|uniref:Trimeric autotransporter adhesin YadA-like head domain-containing protein n=1 Tax=uncultured Caudovirales phage TaxID=2100421 RepID=A0A6J5L0H3_9CAUD|nr:hypothetical protein UFOVP78_13 [uncultured Caudovirales phage]